MTRAFPGTVLTKHTAVFGTTGSGKTSSAKLAVEQVVADDARVCIVDPIKSDWWGLTSSADGKRPGLPFSILGGPKGHLPLHAQAGAALGRIVGQGHLRHSILDMCDFGPGEHVTFFASFAQGLFRHMRGVVYLVIDEAHLFAPKERVGEGAETMSSHWLKRLASGARTKGIRLMVITQRAAELHNTVMANCDTIVAHRTPFPEDHTRIVKWFKAHVDKTKVAEVEAGLATLKTGEAYLCAAEAGIFERRQFPRITTYDNTATPTGDEATGDVRTAEVDLNELRAIIGEAVQEAEANDPKALRKRIAALQAQIGQLEAAPAPNPDGERAMRTLQAVRGTLEQLAGETLEYPAERLRLEAELLRVFRENMHSATGRLVARFREQIGECLVDPTPLSASRRSQREVHEDAVSAVMQEVDAETMRHVKEAGDRLAQAKAVGLQPRQLNILTSLARWRTIGNFSPNRVQVAFLANRGPNSSSYDNDLGKLRSAGHITYPTNGHLALTDGGAKLAGPQRAATMDEYLDLIRLHLEPRKAKILDALIQAGRAVSRETLAKLAGRGSASSSYDNDLGSMRTLGLIEYPSQGQVGLTDLALPPALVGRNRHS